MYCCICYTCGEEELVDDFTAAQDRFNAHATSYHEVELFNLDAARTLPAGVPSVNDAAVEGGEAADE